MPGPRHSQRARSLEPFLAMEVMERAFELEAAGERVLHLEIGEPDFAPPPAALAACERALRDGETHYTDSRGLAPLREAIAADVSARSQAAVEPEQVIVTMGTSPAMLMVFSLLIEPGDEVLMAEPYYPCYPNFVRYCGGLPVSLPTRAEDGYALDPEAVAAARTPRTKAVIAGSPANPTGAIQSEESMRGLAALGLPIVSDEIYDGLVYDGARTTSALRVCDEPFVLDGFSKRYAMTGFRLGYVIAPLSATRALQIMHQNLFISASRFVQHAGIAALRDGAETVEAIRSACERRRGRLVEGLRALGFGVPRMPPGAFYVLADASHLGSDSRALSLELLERAGVGAGPGVDFGEAGEGMLRFCYAVAEEVIEEALERLAEVVPQLAAEKARATA